MSPAPIGARATPGSEEALRRRPGSRHPRRQPSRPPVALTALPLLLALLTGCESTPSTERLDQALADYEGGRLSSSFTIASDVARRDSGDTGDQAAYLAGLAAYRMGRHQDAERYLLDSSRSSDPTAAGNARAQLGLLRLDQNRPSEAAELFREASGMLTGGNASRAAQYAAASYEQAGDTASARRYFSMAARTSHDRPAASTSSAGFVLQVGAFQERARAERAAAQVMKSVERAGLGTIRIIPRTDHRARKLYLVQFGRFTTRKEAAAARARLGKLEYIVAPAS